MKGYFDFDWAGDNTIKKFISGLVFILNGVSVSWYSKKQAKIVLLSTELGCIALTLATKEVI